MRGRKPLPMHLKLVRADHHTDRHNKAEAKPAVCIPEPPPELSADAREEWDRTSLRLYAAGLLTGIDGSVLAAYCQAYGRWVQAERALAEMAARDAVPVGCWSRPSMATHSRTHWSALPTKRCPTWFGTPSSSA